jgi:N-acetyl sugar amidotransferase
MDTSDPKITFDAEGHCTHCRRFALKIRKDRETGRFSAEKGEELIAAIKAAGRGRDFDCILGLSGGVDSSYLAYFAHQKGLRAYCVHLDNSWDSEIAARNIERIVKKLGFPLHTHVVDWEEFRDIQLSFFKASVIDLEVVTDQAINALLYQLADQKGIPYIISGNNSVGEFILPYSWFYYKHDVLNLIAIHQRFGTKKIETYPLLDDHRRWIYENRKGIRGANLLEYFDYDPLKARAVLAEKLGWRSYGRKHCESVFTQFYQEYILPRKFGADKRRAHLSSLVCAGRMSRADALEEIAKPMNTEENLRELKSYVLKKWGLTEGEFDEIMARPPKEHTDYPAGLPPRQ